MSVNVILQARMSSSRLPGKVLMDVCGAPMLARQIERVSRASHIDRIIIATSDRDDDQPVADLAAALGVSCVRGPLMDVLERFRLVAEQYPADHYVRLTGDCPLTDPGLLDELIEFHIAGGYDISTLGAVRTFPHGLDAEVMTAEALLTAARECDNAYEREHTTPFLYHREGRFKVGKLTQPVDDSGSRWTVDFPEDLQFVRAVFGALLEDNPDFSWRDVKAYLAVRPDIQALNACRCTLPQQDCMVGNGGL